MSYKHPAVTTEPIRGVTIDGYKVPVTSIEISPSVETPYTEVKLTIPLRSFTQDSTGQINLQTLLYEHMDNTEKLMRLGQKPNPEATPPTEK
jgi:hypothetical protein